MHRRGFAAVWKRACGSMEKIRRAASRLIADTSFLFSSGSILRTL
jgi:hypothetical protein